MFERSFYRLDLLREGPNNFKTIGLNSINYTVQCIDESPAYTWIFTTLRPEVVSFAKRLDMENVS